MRAMGSRRANHPTCSWVRPRVRPARPRSLWDGLQWVLEWQLLVPQLPVAAGKWARDAERSTQPHAAVPPFSLMTGLCRR